jgi:hypothetical protein
MKGSNMHDLSYLYFSIKFSISNTYYEVELALRFPTGILNQEWAVRPPSNNNAAIPDDATTRAIRLSHRTLPKIRLYKKVFPVPPGPSTKKRCVCMHTNLQSIFDNHTFILLLKGP